MNGLGSDKRIVATWKCSKIYVSTFLVLSAFLVKYTDSKFFLLISGNSGNKVGSLTYKQGPRKWRKSL